MTLMLPLVLTTSLLALFVAPPSSVLQVRRSSRGGLIRPLSRQDRWGAVQRVFDVAVDPVVASPLTARPLLEFGAHLGTPNLGTVS